MLIHDSRHHSVRITRDFEMKIYAERIRKDGDRLLPHSPIHQPPDRYADAGGSFIVPRIPVLTHTAHDMAPWGQPLGDDGSPFAFDPERRAVRRAELDASYARLGGLTRDGLRYIPDPAHVAGTDYPTETRPVIKASELRQFGEYRTRRLVLEACDRMDNESTHRC